MKLKTKVLILGAGFAGLIFQREIKKHGEIDCICVEKGYSHERSDDYVVLLKNKFDFAYEKIKTKISKVSSGSKDFEQEYSKKLYNKEIEFKTFNEKYSSFGYKIDANILLDDANIYGNIDITSVDLFNKKVFGKVLHLNENVEISFDYLISTLPLTKFSKLCSIELLKTFNMFASFYPIGIKKQTSITQSNNMIIDYLSDPNIPFYRKQHYKSSIYYEYCINKEMKSEKFNSVVVPGKFLRQDDSIMQNIYDFYESKNVFLIGRNSCWNPDFLLDHIILNEGQELFQQHISNAYGEILNEN